MSSGGGDKSFEEMLRLLDESNPGRRVSRLQDFKLAMFNSVLAQEKAILRWVRLNHGLHAGRISEPTLHLRADRGIRRFHRRPDVII